MSAIDSLHLTPVAAEIDNPDEWGLLADQITAGTALPPELTPDTIVALVATAVPLLFKADAGSAPDLLRGTFADPVVAQCQRNAGSLSGAEPGKVVVHLVGSRVLDGHPVVRIHLSIQTQDANGESGVQNQFWDLEVGGQVTVGQTTCPNCGAPLSTGELVCSHCHTDVRSVADVPLVVSRLELY